jgi:hypothetical protein
MKRTTIFIPETLERDLQLYARKAGRPMASVVREAVEQYLAGGAARVRLPSFAGVGSSGRSDTADRHESILFAGLEPHGAHPTAREIRYRRPRRAKRR